MQSVLNTIKSIQDLLSAQLCLNSTQHFSVGEKLSQQPQKYSRKCLREYIIIIHLCHRRA